MTSERVVIRAKELSDEDLDFQEQDKKKIEEPRAELWSSATFQARHGK